MNKYQNIVSVWLNPSKDGKGCYLAIKNETDQELVIPAGKSMYANMNTRMPIASKSIKIEDEKPAGEANTNDVSESSIPF